MMHSPKQHKNKRSLGAIGETIALSHYLEEGWKLVERNYTIKGGEIDLIVTNESQLVFVEVKVVNTLDDISGYITSRKLSHLTRAIQHYLRTYPTDQTIQIDVVFIHQGVVAHIYRNVTLYL